MEWAFGVAREGSETHVTNAMDQGEFPLNNEVALSVYTRMTTSIPMRVPFVLIILIGVTSCTGLLPGKKADTFSPSQSSMIMAAAADVPMRIFVITNYEDSLLLRSKSEDIIPNPKDKELQHFLLRLQRTVTDSMAMGVGIAAPQVGILKNIVLVQRFDKEGFPFEAYLNPVIRQYSEKKRPCREGCLSIPGRVDTTQDRSYAILIEYDRPDGSHNIEMVEDFTAVIFQHEIDHLHGIIYLDHLAKEIKDSRH
ncbi:MAG: peptide deformylase [Bacteroidia bacterium]|nr:peptide deformylase [Bacteroidia bacterium]